MRSAVQRSAGQLWCASRWISRRIPWFSHGVRATPERWWFWSRPASSSDSVVPACWGTELQQWLQRLSVVRRNCRSENSTQTEMWTGRDRWFPGDRAWRKIWVRLAVMNIFSFFGYLSSLSSHLSCRDGSIMLARYMWNSLWLCIMILVIYFLSYFLFYHMLFSAAVEQLQLQHQPFSSHVSLFHVRL